jgi:hypothetical protein
MDPAYGGHAVSSPNRKPQRSEKDPQQRGSRGDNRFENGEVWAEDGRDREALGYRFRLEHNFLERTANRKDAPRRHGPPGLNPGTWAASPFQCVLIGLIGRRLFRRRRFGLSFGPFRRPTPICRFDDRLPAGGAEPALLPGWFSCRR